MAFESEIDSWLHPSLFHVVPLGQVLPPAGRKQYMFFQRSLTIPALLAFLRRAECPGKYSSMSTAEGCSERSAL
jgi:hypothetical protein